MEEWEESRDVFPSPIEMMTESSRMSEDVVEEKPSPVRDQSLCMLLDKPVETMNSSSSSYGPHSAQTIRFEREDSASGLLAAIGSEMQSVSRGCLQTRNGTGGCHQE